MKELTRLLQTELRDVLLRADAAVFPNRQEGGTNLVAMEALGCGVPCIISNRTGQADIAIPDIAHVLPGGMHSMSLFTDV